MLRWVIIFFVLTVVAAAFGYGGISADLTEIAKMLFFLFVVLFVGVVNYSPYQRGVAC